ncbi:MAG: PCMD domain-containing protein [Muribaculaceae bacterium]|nr:PCMD domain-containing protein [Muribaculaceae bacterium]
MKYIKSITMLALALAAVSCIKDEPLNSECDITAADLPGVVQIGAPVISNTSVEFSVRYDQGGPDFAPVFEVTEGATINPPSGTIRDFTTPQIYTVTSQNGEWHKDYTVRIRVQDAPSRPDEELVCRTYDFEHVYTTTSIGRTFDVFFQPNDKGEEEWSWGSANSAFALTLQAKVPNEFPTYQGENGADGKCAVLVTKSTGTFGATVKKPMAAGNLFFGAFDVTNAMAKPLEATHFGMLWNEVPISFSGFYKYKSGDIYYEPDSKGKLQEVPGKRDLFNLYCVFFEATEDMPWLDGSNVLAEDNPNIISTALIPDRRESDEWVEFSVPFTYREGKTIDLEKLRNGAYRLALVMSSSQEGDYFSGAFGSTLQVDQLSVVSQNKNNQLSE